MRRTAILALLLALPAHAAERFSSQCRTNTGPISAGCTVTVFDGGTVNVSAIFSDAALTIVKSNPFTADSNGRLFFYAADGQYDVQLTGGTPSLPTTTIGDVSLGTGGAHPISSVFTRTGAIVATTGDFTAAQITNAGRRDAVNDWGAFHQVYDGVATPATPPAGSVHFYVDAFDTVLKVRKPDGSVVSLEQGAATSSGTVTSVALTAPAQFSITGSPITTAGTLAIAWQNQTANFVLAGPASGVPAAPTFRAIVDADIPDLNALSTGLAASRCVETDVSGNLSVAAAPCSTAAGTVTSVALTVPAIFSVAGSPITTSGTLAVSLVSQAQNTVWAAPSGGAGNPSFRLLVAGDIPNLDAAKITTGELPDARVSDAITLTNITQITNRALVNTTGDLAASRVDDGGVSSTWPLFSGGGAAAAFRAIAKTDLPGVTVYTDQVNTYTAGFKQTFQADATTAGIRVPCAALPSAAVAGDIACDSVDSVIKFFDGVGWQSAGAHAMLSATHSDSLASAVSRGSIIRGNATPAWEELPLGASNLYIKSDGTDLLYSTLPAAGVGTCTNQFARALNADTAPTCESIAVADLPTAASITWTGFHDFQTGTLRPPERTFAGLPAASGVTGRIFIVTDSTAVDVCGGGGSTAALCRSDGTSYQPLAGGGGGGGGGWSDSGTIVVLVTSTDGVGIGTSTRSGKLSIEGNTASEALLHQRLVASATGDFVTGLDDLSVRKWGVTAAGEVEGTGFQTLASVSAGVVKNDGSGIFSFGGTIAKSEAAATFVHTDQANTYDAGDKQTFQSSATTAGMNIAAGSDPSGLATGDIWVNGDSLKYRGTSLTRVAEFQANKNAASGYAGLSASSKLTLSQGQEVWALADLTDVSATTGSGSTAVLQTSPTLAGIPKIGDGAGNDFLEFIEEATNPSCTAGVYGIWANSTDTKLKKCENGTITDLGGGGGATPGGNVNDVQLNDGASGFTADNLFEFDPSTDTLILGGTTSEILFSGANLQDCLITLNNGTGSADYCLGIQTNEFRFSIGTSSDRFEWGVGSNFSAPLMIVNGTGPAMAFNETVTVSTIAFLLNAPGVDGNAIALSLENDQTNTAASTNEEVTLSFAFGGIRDVAHIRAGKEGDYTSAANRDSSLSFRTELNDTLNQWMYIPSDGGVRWTDSGAQPTCDAAHRGTVWYEAAGAGVKDQFEVCAKDAGDAYAWRVLY